MSMTLRLEVCESVWSGSTYGHWLLSCQLVYQLCSNNIIGVLFAVGLLVTLVVYILDVMFTHLST